MTDAPPPAPVPRFGRSDLIAVIALTISVLGTVAALWQNSILSEQLELSNEQKGAAAWPALDVTHQFSYLDTEEVWRYTFGVENEGVGPGLLAEVSLQYRGRDFDSEEAGRTIAAGRPGYLQSGTQTIEKDVVAAGEVIDVFTVYMPGDTSLAAIDSLRALTEAIEVSMCYCSVYGDCWEYVKDDWPRPVPACAGIPQSRR